MNSTLPPFVIADLYKNTLVVTGDVKTGSKNDDPQFTTKKTEEVAEPLPPVNKKWWLGDNKRNIAVIVNDEENAFINDDDLSTLMKLLEALKMNMGDIAIINIKQHDINFALLKEQLQPRYALMFGVTTQQIQLPFTMPDYQVQQHGNCTILSAPAITLSVIKDDKAINAEKRKLWESLKRIFA